MNNPTFFRLPNEIIKQIILHVLPEDLENLAQVNRHVRLVSLSVLPDHRARIRKYSFLTLNVGYPGPPERLLNDLLVNPLTAHYIRRLRVDHWGVTEKERGYRVESADMESIIAAAGDSEYLTRPKSESSNPSYWREQMLDVDVSQEEPMKVCSGDMLLAILLPLLPNLTTLDMHWYLEDSAHWLLDMIRCVPQAKIPALTKLKFVHLDGLSLEFVIAFSALRSIKLVTAPDSFCYDNRSRDFQNTPPPCYVNNLELYESIVGPGDLYDFLLRCEDLQSFAYSRINHQEISDVFDASMIRTALIAHTTDTLQRLTLLAPEQERCFIGPLHSFQVLQELSIDWDLLLPDQGIDITAKTLCHLLPASLQILAVHEENGHKEVCYKNLIESIALSKGSELPLLTKLHLTFQREDPFFILSQDFRERVRQRCSDVGVVFTHKQLDSRYHPAHKRSDGAYWEAIYQ